MKKYPKYKNTNIEWLEQIPEHWMDTKLKYIVKIKSGEGIKSEDITPIGFFPVFGGNGILGYTNEYNNDEEVLIIGRVGAKCGNVRLVNEKKWISDNALYAKTNIHKVYLLYKLESINLNNLANKNAQPLITSTMIIEQIIPLPPLSEQKAIADYLDKKTNEIDQIIDAKKKLIALYNEEKSALINRAVTKGIDDKAKLKPSGVEWLGDIPQHWEVKKLKFVAVVNQDSLPDSTDKELIINYVEISDVKYGNGIINQTEYRFEDAPSRAKRIVKDGDIIISTVRTYLKSIAVISNPLKNMIVSTGFAVITPVNISSAYLGFIANSNKFVAVIISLSVGVSYPAINPDGIMNINIPLPPLKEQEKIVDYIEKNVSVIDKKIANAKRLIELMSEYRTTLISEVVTGKVKVV